MRALNEVTAGDPAEFVRVLRDALTGDGPAILPRERRSPPADGRDGVGAAAAPSEVPQNTAVVIETSGSTGTPKRVALSTDALLASAAASASAVGGQGQWLLALPVHYVAGVNVVVRSIAADTEPVTLAPGHFDPVRFGEVASEMTGDGRYVSLVPVQLTRLVEESQHNPRVRAAMRRFDRILLGGHRPSAEVLEQAADLDLRVSVTYGASETCGGCVYDGVPIGNTRARVVAGRLELAGAVLANGYLDDPERTDAAFYEADGARWYRTGDLGAIADGRVTVLGRSDNVIISGGEKVSLDAVEAAVRELDGFRDAVVVSADSEEWGQVPVVIAAAPAYAGSHGLAAALPLVREHVTARLGRAAGPARIVAVGTIPLLASGKPDRIQLARLAAHAVSG
jgi:O-succinylbenzoic acid--CoA ligase